MTESTAEPKTWTAPEITHDWAPTFADERTMLEGWLDFHRQTLLRKCGGLTADQLKLRSVEPSGLSLLGLVRHMAEVERWWFRRQFAGQQLYSLYCDEASPNGDDDGDFNDLDTADAPADFATFHTEVDLADKAAAGRSLDDSFLSPRGKDMNLRWVYVHMIEEYARHNGHADLIRERIDGATGQ